MPDYDLPPTRYVHPQVAEVRFVEEDPNALCPFPKHETETCDGRTWNVAPDSADAFHENQDEFLSHGGSGNTRRKLTVIFINGMNTSQLEAARACSFVAANLGIERNRVKLLYNSSEDDTVAGLLKVSGGMVSRRVGGRLERECIKVLCRQVENVVRSNSDRLLVVGHSQGSLIFQNATDTCYDRYSTNPSSRRLWNDGAKRIEAIFYAPIIRHAVPGLRVFGFMNESDCAGRTASCISGIGSSGKSFLGWRPYEPIDMVVSPSSSNLLSTVCDPLSGHNWLSLVVQDAKFNMLYLCTGSDGRHDPVLLANRLAHSIRHGLRPERVHKEVMKLAVNRFHSSFARPFLKHVKPIDKEMRIGDLCIEPRLLVELKHLANDIPSSLP